jgi:hypothetical protein
MRSEDTRTMSKEFAMSTCLRERGASTPLTPCPLSAREEGEKRHCKRAAGVSPAALPFRPSLDAYGVAVAGAGVVVAGASVVVAGTSAGALAGTAAASLGGAMRVNALMSVPCGTT